MTDSTTMAAHHEIPDGLDPQGRGSWPSRELIQSFLGDSWDFELRPGETVPVGTEEAAAAARHFRDVLSRFASGVTVVTGVHDDEPVGLTCQSFSSVSLDPPLVLFCPAHTSRAWPRIREAGRFCVNFLADDQAAVSDQFAVRGSDKFAGVGWRPSPVGGTPVLDGVVGYVDCTLHAVHEAGDHDVVIGRVVDLGYPEDGAPEHGLTFYRGRYGSTRD